MLPKKIYWLLNDIIYFTLDTRRNLMAFIKITIATEASGNECTCSNVTN